MIRGLAEMLSVHSTVLALLVLDRNTWNLKPVCILFVLGKNTCYHITVAKITT